MSAARPASFHARQLCTTGFGVVSYLEACDRAVVGVKPGGTRGRRQTGPLTRRERELVAELLEGRTNKEVAQRQGVSEQTVRNQLRIVYAKLGVSNRLELVVKLMTQGGKG